MRTITILAISLTLSSAMAARISGRDTAGVGMTLRTDGDYLAVAQLSPDGSAVASRAIHAGDRIVAVAQQDGKDVRVKGRKIAEVVSLIRGPKGTTVRLTIVPVGKDESQARVVSLVRGELKVLARWGDGELLRPGAKAPNVPLVPLEGQTTGHLADHAGKVVVLEFWATWCGPCQGKMAELQRYPEKYPGWKDKVSLVAAAFVMEGDDEGEPIKHVKARGWDKTHNVRASAEVMKAYHVNALPTVYIINQKGNVVESSNVGDIPEIVNRLLRENGSPASSTP
jgi:thiol-disulfide isomerase/thioredoxin